MEWNKVAQKEAIHLSHKTNNISSPVKCAEFLWLADELIGFSRKILLHRISYWLSTEVYPPSAQPRSADGSMDSRVTLATALLTAARCLHAKSRWVVTLGSTRQSNRMRQAKSSITVLLVLSTSHMKRWWGSRTMTLSCFRIARTKSVKFILQVYYFRSP